VGEPARNVVVSTHFDDAVLSVARLLLDPGRRTTVATVCAGSPGDDLAAGWWDSLAGFADAADAWRARRAEDLAACAASGARGVHLDFADGQYWPERVLRPDVHELRAAVAGLVQPGDVLWLPAGLGWQRDHRAVRDALLPLLASHPGGGMVYADSPYAGIAGWDTPDDQRDEADRWGPELASIRAQVPLGGRRDAGLDDASFRAKLELVRCHRSQLIPLGQSFPGFAQPGGVLATEVSWPVAAG
jgi:hypothetical protein